MAPFDNSAKFVNNIIREKYPAGKENEKIINTRRKFFREMILAVKTGETIIYVDGFFYSLPLSIIREVEHYLKRRKNILGK